MPPQLWVVWESNPEGSEERLIYSQARLHSGLTTLNASERPTGIEPAIPTWQAGVSP